MQKPQGIAALESLGMLDTYLGYDSMRWIPSVKTNGYLPIHIAPETLGFEDEFSLWEGLLVGAMLVF